MNKENPVGWFEIYVDDMVRATKFYEAVFATKLSDLASPTGEEMSMMAFPMSMESKGGAAGALVKMEGFKAGNNSTIVYFLSEDCSIEEARIEAAGGKIFKPKMSIGEHGFISLLIDTEGNLVGIHSMK